MNDQQSITFPEPIARNTDPETSHDAAAMATFKANPGRIKALQALWQRDPLTDFELAAITGLQQTSIGKRRGECAEAGLVEACRNGDKLVKRPTPSGAKAIAWKLTPAGAKYVCTHDLDRPQ